MIIDAHVYSLPKELRNREYVFPDNEVHAPTALHWYQNVKESERALALSSPQEILMSMQSCGIDKTVLTALPWTNHEICMLNNRHVLEFSSSSPNFMSVCSVQPLHDDWQNEAKYCVEHGAIGIKINPAWQGFNLSSVSTMDLANFCADADIFLEIHIDHMFKQSVASSTQLCSLLQACPHTKILATHLGGLLGLYCLHPPIAKLLKNVWFDTAVSSTLQYVDFYIQVGLQDKVIFGSDFPFNHSHSQKQVLDGLLEYKYNADILDKIFNTNFKTLCGTKFK